MDDLRSSKGFWSPQTYDHLEGWLLFTGYPRSGHTLMGSLIDAHPNTLISHELDLFYYLKRGYSKFRLYQMIRDNAEAFTLTGRNWTDYNYRVDNQWQGKFKEIRFIGDKSGGMSTRRLLKSAHLAEIDLLRKSSGLPITFIHVIRNPYDIITTMTKRTSARRNVAIDEELLRKKINHFFKHARGVERLKQESGCRVINVYHEKLVSQPTETLAELCVQIGLATPADYLAACAEIVWQKAKTSRQDINLWTEPLQAEMKEKMDHFSWFAPYSFTSGLEPNINLNN